MDFKLSREDDRLKEYELNVRQEEGKETTELGYRDMNRRFLDMEKAGYSADEWAEKKKVHETRKEELEKKWHRITEKRKKELDKSGKKGFSDTESGYYDDFELKDMEVFLKNSDRGGNSVEFNNVATDLELYNVISGNGDTFELIHLLTRLKDSCDAYISARTTCLTPKGRRRRAMIRAVQSKVNGLLNENYGSITADAGQAYDKFKASAEDMDTEEKKKLAETACRTQFNQIFQDLSENRELTEEERTTVDARMAEVLRDLKQREADKNQSPNLSTRFFNAIGWAAHKPHLCRGFEEDEEKRSPTGIKMYHSMNTFKGITDCKGLAEQLKGQAEGNSRQYYSAGNFGKGTYTAVRALNTKDKSRDEKNEIDKKASEHSWDFGKNIGAVQLTMMLNENARIIAYPAALALAKEFKKKYPSTYEVLHHEEIREGYSYAIEPAITAIIAFYGYNTLRVEKGCGADIDYYITTDRNAFMIDISKQMIRDKDGIEPY